MEHNATSDAAGGLSDEAAGSDRPPKLICPQAPPLVSKSLMAIGGGFAWLIAGFCILQGAGYRAADRIHPVLRLGLEIRGLKPPDRTLSRAGIPLASIAFLVARLKRQRLDQSRYRWGIGD